MSLSTLSTKDLAALCQRSIVVSDEPAFDVVKNNPLLAALKADYSIYDSAYAKKSSSGKGDLLLQADDNRDVPFGALKAILVGHIRAVSSPFNKDAVDIYAVIEKYGLDLNTFKYAEETAQMKKLIEELDKPENVSKIENMMLTPIVEQLKDAQTAFEGLFNEVAGENAELRLLDSATNLRKRLHSVMHSYFGMVKAMSSQPGWRELYAKLDELFKAAFNKKSGKQVLPPPPPAAK